jgi:hypothetical protein
MRWQIREYGCYLMCLLWLGNKLNNVPLSASLISEDLYVKYQKHGWMDEECFIKQPVKILNDLGVDVTTVRKVPADHEPLGRLEILYFRHAELGGHFVAGDGHGNVTYDPWGVSRAATEGTLESKRVFA